ncbi:hypothetical protein, partial [Staphylococcus aureus]
SWAAFALNDPLPGLIDLPLTAFRVLKKRILPGLSSRQPAGLFLQPVKRLVKYTVIRAGLEVSSLPAVRSAFPSLAGRGVIFTLHHVRPGGAVSAFA